MPNPNLVLNPGFETGNFTDWTVSDPEPNNPDIGVDSQPLDVNSGSYGVFAGNETSTLSQTIQTHAGYTYSVSFYLDVYQSAAIDGEVTVTFGGKPATTLVEPAETDAFVKYTASVHVTSNSSVLEFTLTDPGGYFGLDDVSVIQTAACYVRGTRILTEHGDVEIENLRIGDRVVTASGALEEIRWIGRRRYSAQALQRQPDLLPICFRAGSLGEGAPARDLMVSRRHAMFLDDALIPAECLVNGSSIVCETVATQVEYFHVELAAHHVIIAEGAFSESFVDDDSRRMFDNADEYAQLYPQARPMPARYCAPRICDGYKLQSLRERFGAPVAHAHAYTGASRPARAA